MGRDKSVFEKVLSTLRSPRAEGVTACDCLALTELGGGQGSVQVHPRAVCQVLSYITKMCKVDSEADEKMRPPSDDT